MAPPPAEVGMPLDAFLDDLRGQLREVHWHLRGHGLGCEGTGPREVDLRDGTVTLAMSRVAQVEAGASLKLVAVPIGPAAITPAASAEAARKHSEAVTLALAVAGDAPVVDIDAAPPSQAPIARTANAVIDGFVRSAAGQPCMRLSTLRIELVVDVSRAADGSFKVVVPPFSLDAGASERSVNTLTLDWKKIESRALR